MDDVRLFTKDYTSARKVLLLIDRMIRSLHLNTQSAKTEILSESSKEITSRLIDTRLDTINVVIDKIKEKKFKLTSSETQVLKSKLAEVAKKKPFSPTEMKLIGSQKPLTGC